MMKQYSFKNIILFPNYFLCLFIAITINICSYAQIEGRNILPSVAEFKDKIYSCEENEYLLALSGHYESGIYIEDTIVNKSFGSTTLYKADDNGYISDISRYSQHGGQQESALSYRLKIDYDNFGHIISMSHFLLPSSIDDISLLISYKYNSIGQLTESVSKNTMPFNNSTITTTYYWSDEKVDSAITISNFGQRTLTTKQCYVAVDTNGSYNVIRNDGTIELSKEFNKEGVITRSVKLDDGIKCVTIYNDHGFVIYEETPEYDEKNNVSITKYSGYEYDKHGNWIKRVKTIIVDGKEIPNTITERTIAYSSK